MKTRIAFVITNASCLILFCAAALDTRSATVTVTSTADSGAGTLRQAIADAMPGDTIDFSVPYPATILLTGGTLSIHKNLTIAGPGPANLSVNGNSTYTVFYIGNGTTVSISSLTITNGVGSIFSSGGAIYNDGYFSSVSLTVSNCTISGNRAGLSSPLGGAIYNSGEYGSATLTILDSTISGNSNNSFLGGAIFNSGAGGNAYLEIVNSTLAGNSTADSGGAIYSWGGESGNATLIISNSTLVGNSASYSGGAIFNDGSSGNASLTIVDSNVKSNSAVFGGGLINYGFNGTGPVWISSSTFSHNSASSAGSAIYNGISMAAFTIQNSTLSGNLGFVGSGIYLVGSPMDIGNSTISDNSGFAVYTVGASLRIGNTIVKGDGSRPNLFRDGGTIVSYGYNLSSDNGSGFLTATGDQTNTDPKLGPLQNNGGPTHTHALQWGSPAIDKGKRDAIPALATTVDQRGAPRPLDISAIPNAFGGDGSDIGAFEVNRVGYVQQPINVDGSSKFSAKRGVVPVKFVLEVNGVPTCDLPPATICVTRIAGASPGPINESTYSMAADNGSNFRISACQYVYNINSKALGAGTYLVEIKIGNTSVGCATFVLE